MSFETQIAKVDDVKVALPLMRPAAPIAHKFDPNRFSWINYIRNGANLLNEWDERHYSKATYQASVAGMELLYLNDDALIAEVLQDTSGAFVRSNLQSQVLDPILGQGLLSVDGEEWRAQRKVMAPVFQPKQVAAFEDHMRQSTQRLIDKWQAKPPRRAIDIIPAMSSLTLDFIANALFGGLDPSQHTSLAKNTHSGLAKMPLLNAGLLLNPFKKLNQKLSHFTFRKQINQLDKIAEDFVRRYRADGEAHKESLLGRLIAAQEAEQDGLIDERFVRDQIATFLLAGHETTGKALAFTLYLLALDKPRCARLMEDLAEKGEASPYLDHVIKEALRLYPPAVIINRDTTKNMSIGGIDLKKGAVIMISPWLVNRNPESWVEADKFWPERWETECIKERRYSYLPFGAGPRVCIGASLALSEMKIMLTGLLTNFEFDLWHVKEVKPCLAVTISASDGIWLNLKPKKDVS